MGRLTAPRRWGLISLAPAYGQPRGFDSRGAPLGSGVKRIGGDPREDTLAEVYPAREHAPLPPSGYETDHLWPIVARLKQVQIECDEALRVIERFDGPETLFYCDPPYVPATRSRRWRHTAYEHECDDAYHRELAELLHGIEGLVLLSGYESELYQELYGDWATATRTAQADHSAQTTEWLWISPRTAEALRERRLL